MRNRLSIYVAILLAIGCLDLLAVNLSFAGTVDLPKTGQTTCYNSAGSVIPCATTGEDGEFRAGVAWPGYRFTDNGDGTITDNLTGLMWLKTGNCFGTKNWPEALNAVVDLNANPGNYTCGGYTATYNDWVLPNVNELESLINAEVPNQTDWLKGQGFVYVQSDIYWSSTITAKDIYNAWVVGMDSGSTGYHSQIGNYNYVLPVRAGTTPPAAVWKTGQTVSRAAGDDGDLQRGEAWPAPRFTSNGDGTVTDNLTGLMWLNDPNCLGNITWQEGLDKVVDLNTNPGSYSSCGGYATTYNDWRLPNRKELYSLTYFALYSPAFPEGHPFVNPPSIDCFWSSTTVASGSTEAWSNNMSYGGVAPRHKSYNSNAWPVRGQTTLAATTTAVSSITSNSTSSGGNATSDGGVSITARGVCWNTTANPTTSDSKTSDGTGPGSFTSTITLLNPGTTYHVRAYATNIVGTSYGIDLSFSTPYAATLYVCSSGGCGGKEPCYTTIQAAINDAETESVILIAEGIYSESIALNSGETLTLQGGWDASFETQAGTTILRNAPKAPQGSLTLQELSIKP